MFPLSNQTHTAVTSARTRACSHRRQELQPLEAILATCAKHFYIREMIPDGYQCSSKHYVQQRNILNDLNI